MSMQDDWFGIWATAWPDAPSQAMPLRQMSRDLRTQQSFLPMGGAKGTLFLVCTFLWWHILHASSILLSVSR